MAVLCPLACCTRGQLPPVVMQLCRTAEYCYYYHVCLPVHLYISGTSHRNFTEFSVPVADVQSFSGGFAIHLTSCLPIIGFVRETNWLIRGQHGPRWNLMSATTVCDAGSHAREWASAEIWPASVCWCGSRRQVINWLSFTALLSIVTQYLQITASCTMGCKV